jgi:hypothetical protein
VTAAARSRPPLGARLIDAVIDRGLLPDPVLRAAIRVLLRRRRTTITRGDVEARNARKRALLASSRPARSRSTPTRRTSSTTRSRPSCSS